MVPNVIVRNSSFCNVNAPGVFYKTTTYRSGEINSGPVGKLISKNNYLKPEGTLELVDNSEGSL